MNNTILILFCALVTALPKIIPLVFLKGKDVKKPVEDYLKMIPFASLAILVLRGLLYVDAGMEAPTYLAALVALLVSIWKENIGLSIVFGVLAAFLALQFG